MRGADKEDRAARAQLNNPFLEVLMVLQRRRPSGFIEPCQPSKVAPHRVGSDSRFAPRSGGRASDDEKSIVFT